LTLDNLLMMLVEQEIIGRMVSIITEICIRKRFWKKYDKLLKNVIRYNVFF